MGALNLEFIVGHLNYWLFTVLMIVTYLPMIPMSLVEYFYR